MKIILIGFMGAGKTTVGNLLAQRLEAPYMDLDEEIVRQEGREVDEIFELFGESGFRKIEKETIEKNLNGDGILSTGGGCIETSETRELLKDIPTVVYLYADFDTLWERIMNDTENIRPLAKPSERAQTKERYKARLEKYAECASYTVDTDPLNPDEVTDAILALPGLKDHILKEA